MKLVYYLIITFLALAGLFFFFYKIIIPFFTTYFPSHALIPIYNEISQKNYEMNYEFNLSEVKVVQVCYYDYATLQKQCVNQTVDLKPAVIDIQQSNPVLSLIYLMIFTGNIFALLLIIYFLFVK